ncbi:MAG: efflux RND transporter periplasmic adaptor subunit [Desulfarculus sp.]|nr:MAG: efflux RND transporter periplasmic adaptor subunit [Desulfarculus sp.]
MLLNPARYFLSAKTCLVLAVLALCSVLAPACSQDKDRPRAGAQRPPVPVVLAQAAAKDVPLELKAIGRVEPLATVSVTARVSGQLKKVHFAEGDNVVEGEVLFTIDPRPYQAALDQAQANLARDRAYLVEAQQDVVRYAAMLKGNFVSQQQYDQAVAKAQSLKATVAADAAAIETARLNLEFCTIRSPLAGRTGQLLVNAGNQVQAGGSQPLVVINQVQPVYVGFSLPERDLPLVVKHRDDPDLLVRAELPRANGTALQGRLSFIDNKVDADTGTVRLRGTFANQNLKLWPGLFVDAYLRLTVQKQAVVVPSRAALQGPAGPVVFVVGEGNQVRMQPVKVSRYLGGEAIIAQGIKAGQKVVTDGQLLLYPEATVVERKVPSTAQSLAAQVKASQAKPGQAKAVQAEPKGEAKDKGRGGAPAKPKQ